MLEPEPEPPPPEVKVEVALPPPTRKPPPKIKPPPEPPPPLPIQQPVVETPPLPPKAAPAPLVAAIPRPVRDPLAVYLAQIVAHVEKNLRYPRVSQSRREEGISMVRLTLDPNGKVLGATIERRSGHRALDEEAIAVIRRAEPFPIPPADAPLATRDFTLPINFKLR
jgi:protein TonB